MVNKNSARPRFRVYADTNDFAVRRSYRFLLRVNPRCAIQHARFMPEIEQNLLQLRKLRVRAEREVAYESPDHLIPWGTRRDNSRHRRFNQKLYQLFGEERPPIWVLDLGCSGGGFVKDCLDDGCMAVGIEGSDFSKRTKRAEWRTIPEHLFTADITKPFEVFGEFPGGEKQLKFDVITNWEVMEHIHERDIPGVVENVKKHLKPGGLWIMSV